MMNKKNVMTTKGEVESRMEKRKPRQELKGKTFMYGGLLCQMEKRGKMLPRKTEKDRKAFVEKCASERRVCRGGCKRSQKLAIPCVACGRKVRSSDERSKPNHVIVESNRMMSNRSISKTSSKVQVSQQGSSDRGITSRRPHMAAPTQVGLT